MTRGGLASALVEIAEAASMDIRIDEASIPCEILGFDPLYVANEGRFAMFVPPPEASKALDILHAHPLGAAATVAGRVIGAGPGQVTMRSKIGATRIVDMLSGEQLPRIC